MTKITEQGVIVERMSETLEELEKGFKEIYGSNINLNPETPDGQMLGLIAQIKNDISLLIQNNYQQLDPYLATGQWLDQRVAYGGLIRNGASYSYMRGVIVTGVKDTKLFKNYSVLDENKNRWLLVNKTQLNGDGSASVDFRSEELGAFPINKNTELEPETIILGIDKILNVNDVELGVEIESDQDLRLRFKNSHSLNAINSVDSIQANLLDLDDVKKVKILENNTNVTDDNRVEGHTINAIVDGGLDVEIADIIYRYKGCGVGLQGETEIKIQADNGERLIKFDRPKFKNIFVKMELKKFDLFTEIDEQEIKNNLVNLDFGIGETVYNSRLYSTINKSQGFDILSLKIGIDSGSLSANNINVGIREIPRFLANNIEIVEVK